MTVSTAVLQRHFYDAIYGGPSPSPKTVRTLVQGMRLKFPLHCSAIQYGKLKPAAIGNALRGGFLMPIHPDIGYLCFNGDFSKFEKVLKKRRLIYGIPALCPNAQTFVPKMRDSIQSMRRRDLEKLLTAFPNKPGFDEEVAARTVAMQAIRNGDANWRTTFKTYANVLFVRNSNVINNLRRKMIEFITLILREIDSRNPINYPFRQAMEKTYSTFVMSSLLRIFTETVEILALHVKPEHENALRSAERSTHTLVVQALTFMKPRFQKPIGLSDVAEAVHASPAYFSRQFRKQTGHTLTDALQYLRIQHAREMLTHSNDGTLQIALACGFNTPEHFFRTFRKLTGQSPRAYRRAQSV